ncbi:MAG: hypothetical protein ACREBG_17760 [Pyrinomonadaceae bacterium]
MIKVAEKFFLKPGLEGQAVQIMQLLDDLLGPAAHQHPGWCGHASFLQSEERPREVFVIYSWRSEELHAALFKQEEPMLADFYRRYCSAPREIAFYRELAVDVEQDHEGNGQWLGHH